MLYDPQKQRKMDTIQAELTRQENVTQRLLILLIVIGLLVLGVLVGHILDVPGLSHAHGR
jgi:CHASE3 domain sensor protein